MPTTTKNNSHNSFFGKIHLWSKKHIKTSVLIVIIIILLGYWIYHSKTSTSAIPQYVLSTARYGTLTQKVTGSGQVTASNQLDVKSQVSGTILSIKTKVGERVSKGQLLAIIDSTSAALDLENSRIAYAKLTQSAKPGDLENAKNNVEKAYSDAFNAVSSAYIDLPNIISGMKDLLYGSSGYLSDQKSTYLTTTGRSYRDTAGTSYDRAVDRYNASLILYKNLTRNSATSSIQAVVNDTYQTLSYITEALKNTQNAVNFVSTTQSEYYATAVSTTISSVTSWSNTANSDLSSVLSAKNNIESTNNTLNNLITGTDELDLASARISLTQKERAYADYFIRAPFDGIVGRIPVNVYDEASGGTIIATVIGDSKTSTISLNEVDAAKVSSGQKVTLTFDAVDSLTATGTVREADLVGTVTQGVVTYNVKIDINTSDPRIKPGMSVNATIITSQKERTLIVPSSAVKSQGLSKYVEVFDTIPASSKTSSPSTSQVKNPTNSQYLDRSTFGSTTATTTFNKIGSSPSAIAKALTISSATAPRKQTVTIGDSDDMNTEIIGGLNAGDKVVIRTISSTATTATTPNIFSSLGGNRSGATNAARIGR